MVAPEKMSSDKSVMDLDFSCCKSGMEGLQKIRGLSQCIIQRYPLKSDI